MTGPRIRDFGVRIGVLAPGPYNSITDVPGVRVGHRTLIHDEPEVARTGVTVIFPRLEEIAQDYAFAGHFSFNGCGEMTGLAWLDESGLLMSPIALTNTHQVGMVRDALLEWAVDHVATYAYKLAVVAETHDGWLSDEDGFPLHKEHVFEAIRSAASGPVPEGNVGGGTGMTCFDFKGGIGTSSRVVAAAGERYTVGVLVQANFGERRMFRIDGVPVGQEIDTDKVPAPWNENPLGGSIIVVVATDAPLVADQCKRLARRATVGLSRVGGIGHNHSGDLFVAFATGNHVPRSAEGPIEIRVLPQNSLNSLFEATADAVEESILNALVAADTMTGYRGRRAYALPQDELARVLRHYGLGGKHE